MYTVSTAMPLPLAVAVSVRPKASDQAPTQKPGTAPGFDTLQDIDRGDQDRVGSTGWLAGSLTGTGATGSVTGTLLM